MILDIESPIVEVHYNTITGERRQGCVDVYEASYMISDIFQKDMPIVDKYRELAKWLSSINIDVSYGGAVEFLQRITVAFNEFKKKQKGSPTSPTTTSSTPQD